MLLLIADIPYFLASPVSWLVAVAFVLLLIAAFQ